MSLHDETGLFKRDYELSREITFTPIIVFGNLLKGYFSLQIGHILDEDFMQYVTSQPYTCEVNKDCLASLRESLTIPYNFTMEFQSTTFYICIHFYINRK